MVRMFKVILLPWVDCTTHVLYIIVKPLLFSYSKRYCVTAEWYYIATTPGKFIKDQYLNTSSRQKVLSLSFILNLPLRLSPS